MGITIIIAFGLGYYMPKNFNMYVNQGFKSGQIGLFQFFHGTRRTVVPLHPDIWDRGCPKDIPIEMLGH